MGRADRTVHVLCGPFGRHRGVSPINPPIAPLTGYVHRRTAIVAAADTPVSNRPIRLADAASASTPRPPTTCRITGSSAGRSASFTSSYPVDRPKTDCRKGPTGAKARPRNAGGCGRFADLREDRRQYLAIPGYRPTPGTATGHRRNRSSSHGIPAPPTVETEPDITGFACTLRLIRDPPPTARTTC